jgi:hypothetical protein
LQIALSGVRGSIADLEDGARRQVLGHLEQVRNTECYCPSAGNTNLKLIRSA